MSERRLRVLIAPDSYKGTFTSIQVAEALAIGWRSARPSDEILLAPLADGGEGTLEAIAASGGYRWEGARVDDPLGRPITARWLRADSGREAVLEMAEASGLSRVAVAERDPAAATSIGTGQLLAAAARSGVERITLGIGGSATTDGGRGLLQGLGARADDGAAPDLSTLDPALADIDLEVACDVSNPLLGPTGAAAVFGPQKGATPRLVETLDARNAAWADRLEVAAGRTVRDIPGAGAAGGVGFALLAIQDRFRAFALRPGVELAMQAARFADKLAESDLVVTGEGRIDASTAYGKTALAVARRAHDAGVPCIAVGGGVLPEGIEALAASGALAVPAVERLMTLEEAVAAGTGPIERAGARVAALVGTGMELGVPQMSPSPTTNPKPKPQPKAARRKRAPVDPVRKWANYLRRYRPGLVEYVDDGLAERYGRPVWVPRLDPISELILTILTQNTADVNAEKAFVALRERYPSPESMPVVVHRRGADGEDSGLPPAGWGGEGLPPGRAPDWAAVEDAPIDELIDVIRIGGLANQKGPRIRAALRTIREARGDYDLSFLASMPAVEARAWLTTIPGIGKKTASIVLLFCFGLPLFPIDTHVERVSKRIGLLPPKAPLELAHEMALGILAPDRMYELHVSLITHGREICHARFPKHELCPVAERCRFVNPKAP